MTEAIGLRKIIDMICESRSALVGHNVFQDLVFIWSQFIGKLPDTLPSFIDEISKTFPMYNSFTFADNNSIYDTKYISATHPKCQDLKLPEYIDHLSLPSTSLEFLSLWARQAKTDPRLQVGISILIPLTGVLHHEHLRYGVYEQLHEAGYDSFLTSQVFVALAGVMNEGVERDESSKGESYAVPFNL